jgi:hypothetical protein
MFIGCSVGVLVWVTVGLAVEVGFGVLLGEGVALGFWVRLGAIVVALGDAVRVSFIYFFPTLLHPPTMIISSNPNDSPATTLIERLRLPVNGYIMVDLCMSHYYNEPANYLLCNLG